MIIRQRWRHDTFSSVLFVGVNPWAEIAPVPGKSTFSARVQFPTGPVAKRFASRNAAIASALQTSDDYVRALLNDDARAALSAAGL